MIKKSHKGKDGTNVLLPPDAPGAMGMRGQHHDGDDREEAASLQGDQGTAET